MASGALKDLYDRLLPQIVAGLTHIHYNAAGDAGACSDQECDCKGSMDVRLQLSADGSSWSLHTGDPCYDTDHSGFWGASTLGKSADEDIHAVAVELLEGALEAIAQELS